MSARARGREKRDLLQSVQRACRTLTLLADEARPLSPRDVAGRLGINLSTCYHLLNTLEHEGFVGRDASRMVRLGHRIGKLHDAFEVSLGPDPLLVRYLELLNARTGETSYLGVWQGDDVVSVAVREGRGGVRVPGLHLGYHQHAYARAVGRVLLAFRDQSFIRSYLERTNLEQLTRHTTTDPEDILERLEDVRRGGIAIEEEEFTLGVCCIAVPVFGPADFVDAAFSVSIPKARFEVDRQTLVEAVLDVAGKAREARAQSSNLTTHPPGQ